MKQKLKALLVKISRLKIWQLLVILLLMLFVSATLLRLNNLGMIERRQAVLDADKEGNTQKTAEALAELQNYVSAHMNADLSGGVYLESSYGRARDAALQSATNSTNPSSAVYQQASIDCRSRFQGGTDSFRNDYVQCVVARVSALSQGELGSSSLNLPKADAYRHNFYSPRLSFDLAGLSVVLTGVIAVWILAKIIIELITRAVIKRRIKPNL